MEFLEGDSCSRLQRNPNRRSSA